MTNPTLEEVLQVAAVILNDESKWCKKAAARKANGLPCSPLSDAAVQWDIHGALIKANRGLNARNAFALNQAYNHIRSKIPANFKNKDIDMFNDSLTYSQVLPLFEV